MAEKKSSGFVLILSVLVMITLLMVGSYLISSANSEYKIATNQFIASKTYYLAESGINEMLWKIKNVTSTREAFIYGALSEADNISRTNVFGDSRAGYIVSAYNTVPSEAWIIATSTYLINNHSSQRVVKSYISRIGPAEPPWAFAAFSGGRGGQQNGNFFFTGTGVALIANGSHLHANQVFKVQGVEVIINDGAVSSSNVINIVAGGQLTLNNSTQEAPTSTFDMLHIDFDSDSSFSWKNRATVTYTPKQFRDLDDNSFLEGIIFVSGDADIIDKQMTIAGVLVAAGTINISETGKNFTLNSDPYYGGGILARGNVDISSENSEITINGLAYSANNLKIVSTDSNFTINGALAGFDARITASGGPIILNYVSDNYTAVVAPEYNSYVPLIQIDHWEEQY